ncbi:hypothetical protein [Nocardia nepalensis]|uniref:hypothetical protein n=1 Tax=Nocardia nepalensis TaxID=3375448 RepID=UPI003B676D94
MGKQPLVAIAETVFAVQVFEPETVLDNWDDVLRHWVRGSALSDVAGDRIEIAQFIEADVIYRLVLGMEAARVYEAAQDNDATLLGTAVTAIETGTFNRAASILIRSGFDHRLAAISAVTSTDATFDSTNGMRQWIDDLDPRACSQREVADPRASVEPLADTALTPMEPPNRGPAGCHLVRDDTGPGYLAARD